MKSAHILFVDDEQDILSTFKRQLRKSDYQISVSERAKDALQFIEENQVDIVISDMRMPEMDGAEFLSNVAEKWPNIIRILLTGYADTESAIKAINEGQIYSYQTKPWDIEQIQLVLANAWRLKQAEEERERLHQLTEEQNLELQSLNATLEQKVEARTLQLKESHKNLQNNYRNTILIFSQLIEKIENNSKKSHSKIVAQHAKELAKLSGLSSSETNDVLIAASLHDLGLLELPDRLKNKPFDELNESDQALYKNHPIYGEALLMQLHEMNSIGEIIRQHHEKIDGSGYPDGLKEDEISYGAQIVSLVNEYHDILNKEGADKDFSETDALDHLTQHHSKQHNTHLIDLFCNYIKSKNALPPIEEETVEIKDLTAGMELSADLMSSEGILLLSKGITLTSELIMKLKRFQAKDEQLTLAKVISK